MEAAMWWAISEALAFARDLVRAGQDEERQRQALLAAEERLAQRNARDKFAKK
jgi:hypothetical protein